MGRGIEIVEFRGHALEKSIKSGFGEKGGCWDEWDKWDGWDEKREGRFSMEVEGWRDEKCDFEDK